MKITLPELQNLSTQFEVAECKNPTLPEWATVENSTLGKRAFKDRTYNGAQIVVGLPKNHHVDFMGSWTLNGSSIPTIYVSSKMWKAVEKTQHWWALGNLLQHEYLEAKEAIAIARVKFPNANPYVKADTVPSIGGEAHYAIIKKFHKMTDSKYEKNLTIEQNLLGI